MNQPKNEDQDVDNARAVLRADYYRSVRATGDDILRRMRAKEWDDRDALNEAVEEELSQTYWDIYTHAAYQCLQASDNDADALDELEDMGGTAQTGHALLCVAANIAHRLDVLEYIDGDVEEYFENLEELDEPTETEAP